MMRPFGFLFLLLPDPLRPRGRNHLISRFAGRAICRSPCRCSGSHWRGALTIRFSISLRDRGLKPAVAPGQNVELSLDAVSFDLQLTPPLLAQVLRTRAAYSGETVLDILRLQILFQSLQTRLQLRLFDLDFTQLTAEARGLFLGDGLGLTTLVPAKR